MILQQQNKIKWKQKLYQKEQNNKVKIVFHLINHFC